MANKLKFVLLVATVLATMNAGVFGLDIEVELPMPKMADVPQSGMNPDGPSVKFYVKDLVTCRPYCEAVYSKEETESIDTCVRGCHYFHMQWTDLKLDNSTMNSRLSRGTLACHDSCKKSYVDSKKLTDCDNGCGRGVKFAISSMAKDKLEEEVEEEATTSTTTTTERPLAPLNTLEMAASQNAEKMLFERLIASLNEFKERSRQVMANVQSIKSELPPLPMMTEVAAKEIEQPAAEVKPRFQLISSRSIIMTPLNGKTKGRMVIMNNPQRFEDMRMLVNAMRFGLIKPNPEDLKITKVVASIGRVGEKPTVIEMGNDGGNLFAEDEPAEEPFEAMMEKVRKSLQWSSDKEDTDFDYYNRQVNSWAECILNIALRSIFVLMMIMIFYMLFYILLVLQRRRHLMLTTLATTSTSTSGRPVGCRLSNLKYLCKATIPYKKAQVPPSYTDMAALAEAEAGPLPEKKPEASMP